MTKDAGQCKSLLHHVLLFLMVGLLFVSLFHKCIGHLQDYIHIDKNVVTKGTERQTYKKILKESNTVKQPETDYSVLIRS